MKQHPHIPIALLTLVVSLSSTSNVGAQSMLEPSDVANLPLVSAPALSPDGRHVAYVQKVPRSSEEDKGPDYSMLWVVSSDGGQPVAFTSRRGTATRPRWSPDGTHLAFLDRRPYDDEDAKTQVFVIPLGGGEARRVSDAEENVVEAEWTADGEAILFTSRDPKSKERKDAEKKGVDWEVADHNYRHIGLYRVGVDGGEAERVGPTDVSLRQIAVSAAGGTVAALAADTPKVDDSYMFQRLVSIDLGSGELETVWDMPGKASGLRFSHDGEWLACRAGIAARDPQSGSIFVIPAAGGYARNLTPDYEGTVEWLDFDAEGRIVFVATHGTATHLRRIDPAGGDIETLADSGPVYTSARLSGAGDRVVVAASTPAHPTEIMVRATTQAEWTRLTHSYSELEAFALGQQKVIEWEARDGLRIEGILVYPLDYQQGRAYPLVVGVHGGPESAVRNGWHTGHQYLSQLLAHRGALFLMPNYRGSSGRGVGYLLANHGDPAGAEFQDVLDGIEHLIALGLVDRDRVGIMGGSYGGYFSAWAATKHSDRFRVAVVNYGVTNLFSDWADGDIPWEHRLVHWGWFPVDRPLIAMDRSPVSWVRGSTTPTLIMHGKTDPRVPPSQSLELYRGLRLNESLPVEMVLFPREGHGYRESAHRLEAGRRALAWLVQYLELETPTRDNPTAR